MTEKERVKNLIKRFILVNVITILFLSAGFILFSGVTLTLYKQFMGIGYVAGLFGIIVKDRLDRKSDNTK